MHTAPQRRNRCGAFTLIELVVVMAIIALLLTIAAPRYFRSIDRSKEVVLRMNLAQTRDALDKYYGDNGKYPDTLDMLIERKYLRSPPFDPIADNSTSWIISAPEQQDMGGVSNIHSGAEGEASDGSTYKSW